MFTGNQPIDGTTPTVDCVKRVKHAVSLYEKAKLKPKPYALRSLNLVLWQEMHHDEKSSRRRCILVLSGGSGTTTGQRALTEAVMTTLNLKLDLNLTLT